ncbi:MAG: hypothetical protein AAFY88_13500, partial [Acidobacteriota bacterium]
MARLMAEDTKPSQSGDPASPDSGGGTSRPSEAPTTEPAGSAPDGLGVVPPIEDFLGEPTRELEAWSALFTRDVPFPPSGGGGVKGSLVGLIKKLLRPVVRGVTADLWDRQRVFNLIAIETLIHQRDLAVARYREHQAAIERID